MAIMKGGRIMAIYHLSMQIISRSKGQSAVASASYRSGERLIDERTDEVKYYQREVKPETMILAPDNAPEWVNDRQRLWNEVERIEKRKDSQLARELNVALPRELSNDDQNELIRDFVQNEFVNKGMVADIAVHRDDKENPHAHVMLTMRSIDEEGFGKKNRDWNADFANSKEHTQGFVKSGEHCLDIREQWANYANEALERAGIQERITHLSHEARGLEQLPTVHLGHVAHGMEQRGVATDRGDINRGRQDYNQAVVDLQKYREEKEKLEKEKALKEAKRQQNERFYTPSERVHIQEASKYLQAEPSFKNVQERLSQLDKWEKRLDQNSQYLNWKTSTISEADKHFGWIKNFGKQIQEEQEKIEKLNWMNPLKFKENRRTKERSEERIEHLKGEIQFHDEKLNYHREKLDFKDEKSFRDIQDQFKNDRPNLFAKNQQQRNLLNQERSTLQNAENALQNRFVRTLASEYPNNPEIAYMNFKTASQLLSFNKQHNRMVPIDEIKQMKNERDQKLSKINDSISHIKSEHNRLYNAQGYVSAYELHNATVEKYENNPFLKGKMMVSKSAKQEYQNALSLRDQTAKHCKSYGVNDPKDFYKQKETVQRQMADVPKLESQSQSLKQGTSILDGIFQGIQQATRVMERQRQYEKQKTMSRGKGKSKQIQNDMEHEM